MEKAGKISAALCELIRLMVDSPAEVSIEIVPSLDGTLFKLTVAPTDVGKVIGKEGRTARSLRTILHAVGTTADRKLTLDIRQAPVPA